MELKHWIFLLCKLPDDKIGFSPFGSIPYRIVPGFSFLPLGWQIALLFNRYL